MLQTILLWTYRSHWHATTHHKRVTRYSNSCNLSKRSYYRLCLPKCSKTCSLERKVKNINASKQCSKSSLLQLPAKIKGKFELQNQQDWFYLNMIRNVSVKHCGWAFCFQLFVTHQSPISTYVLFSMFYRINSGRKYFPIFSCLCSMKLENV